MNDDVTAFCILPYILFSQVGLLAPLNNSLLLAILVLNWQTNHMSFLFKILTEAPVSISEATFSFSIFTFATYSAIFSLIILWW